ncbi:MAG: hypothetical protein PW786_05995 [Arachidicoccus sp.]|nr:hypothetical protein [Arachidicoccus sp.]
MFIIVFVASAGSLYAQKVIQGHIYGGMNRNSPVDSMKIYTSSGNVSYTDVHGLYMISAKENDTLFVSFQNREVIHYPVSFITTPDKFDVYLNNPGFYDSTYFNELPQVQVQTRSYTKDSLMNRYMYSKVFDYTKPKFNPFSPVTSVVNLFNRGYIKRQARYRKFAETNEQFGYVDSRWTTSAVGRITGIQDDSLLAKFMNKYEPPFSKINAMNELELDQYILDKYNEFKKEEENKK